MGRDTSRESGPDIGHRSGLGWSGHFHLNRRTGVRDLTETRRDTMGHDGTGLKRLWTAGVRERGRPIATRRLPGTGTRGAAPSTNRDGYKLYTPLSGGNRLDRILVVSILPPPLGGTNR